MTIQEALEQRRQNMQQAEQIRQAAKEARTWGVQQNSTLAFTPPKVEVPEEKKTSVDKMWDRNSQPVKIEATTRAKQKRDKAKTDYDNYVKSDEYRQKQAESVRAQQREMDKDESRVFAPTSDFSSPAPQDEMEARLRREKDHAEAAFHASEDRRTREAGRAEIDAMPEEDLALLDSYVRNRDNRQDVFVNDISWLLSNRKENDALKALTEKYGEDKALQLAEIYGMDLHEKNAADAASQGREGVNDGWISATAHNLLGIPARAMGNISGFMGRMSAEANRTGQFHGLPEYTAGDELSAYGGAVTEQTAQNIEGDVYDEEGNLIKDGGFLRELGSVGYQAVMSTADAVARAYMGGGAFGGATLAATGSFSQTMADASRQGATPAQAALLATATAGIEAATEKIPLDDLIKVAKGKGASTVLKNLLRQAGIEASTEELSLFGTLLAEAAILQEKSQYNQTLYTELLAGKPEAEARQAAAMEIWNEVVNTALVSGLSGGLSSLGGSYANARGLFAETQEQINPELNRPKNSQQAPQQEAQPVTPEMQQIEAALAETLGVQPVQTTDNSTGNKSVKLYRGYNQSDDPTKKNLTKQQSVYNILGREDPNEIKNLLPLAYYTENEEDARSYADMDVRQMDEYRKNGIYEYRDRVMRGKDVEGLSEEEYADRAAKRSFMTMHGREPNAGGRVERYDYTPGKVLDLTELGEMTNVDAAYKVLADKFGIEPSELDNILTMGNNFENDFPAFALLRNTPRDNIGTKIVDLAKKAGYDSIRYSEDGNSHYAIITDRQDWDKNLIKDKGLDYAPDVDTSEAVQMGASNTQQQSTEDVQGIKGTGAAERNFTGKAAYQDLLYEGNVQRDRPGDVRPVEVPKTDTQGRKVSETVGNFYGAAVTSDEMANRIEELVQEGALSYDTRTNKQSLENAAAEITKRGEESVRAAIAKNVGQNKIQDGDVEKALLLYAKDANDPNRQEAAAEMMVQLQEMATMSGRNLQLFRLVRRMTPEGQLMAIQKEVRANTEKMIKSGSVKKGFEPVANTELEQEYMKAAKDAKSAKSDQARQEAEQSMQELQNAMYLDAAAQMPATFKAKWDAWRYMAMLGNVKTQVRNLAGNLAFKPYKEVKDKMGALAEKLFVPKDQRTKSLVTDKALAKWAREDAKTQSVSDALKYSAKLGDDVSTQKIRENMQVFNSKALDNVRKFVESVPGAGDMLFKNNYYSRSLAGFLKARGYTAADIQNNLVNETVLNEARSYAIQEAMKATFNDSNAFSDFLSTELRYKGDNPMGKAFNMIAEGVLPFRRTPANIAVRFSEYSPIGVAKGLWDAATKVRKGEMTAATAIDQLTSGLTGSAVMALGFALAGGLNGVKITGSGTDEDEKRQGYQDYALEFSVDGQEYSYKIDWAAPANLPLFVGANIYSALENAGEDTDVSKFTSFIRGMGTAFEPMLSLSCMSSLNDLVEGVRYAEEGTALYTMASQAATSYFTQGIPSLARQTTQAFTENKQTTFTTSDDPTIRDLQSTVAGLGVGNAYKTDKVNAWGEKESTGTELERIINSFFNPGNLKKIDNSAVEQEISRLNATGENVSPDYAPKVITYTDKDGNLHKDQRLTEEQYQTYAQTQGQTARQLVEELIKSRSYETMSDEQKAEAINLAYTYARETAEKAAFPDSLGYSEKWLMETDAAKNKAGYILNKVGTAMLSGAMGKIDSAWDNNYSAENVKSLSDQLAKDFEAYSKMPRADKTVVYEGLTGTTKKYVEAREKGVSHDDFLKTAKTINNVKGTGKYDKNTGKNVVRDIDKRAAIAGVSNLTPGARDILMKAYMTDYDPTDESPTKTEPKYDFIRQEMGLSAKDYVDSYRVYLDVSGKNKEIKGIMNAINCDYATARKLRNLYGGWYKGSDWKNYIADY